MDSKILFLILMIGGVIAAPLGATFNQTSVSGQVSQGAINNTLMATLAAPAPLGIPTTTGNAIGSVLTSLFPGTAPLSLPPDTVNSTLLPAPATSNPAIALSTSAPAVGSSTLAPAVTSTQIASMYTLTIIETETETYFATTSHAASKNTGPILSHGSLDGPLVTSSPFSYGSYGGPLFTGSAVPTTLRNSTIINGSSVSLMSSSRASFNPCEKEPHRCPNINGTKGIESSFGTLPEESPTNDFEVKVTVKGGNFRGGRPFESTGKYHGNCTNGVISTGMGIRPVDNHKSCWNDWMCWARQLIACVGSAVTEIMSPAT